MKLNLFTTSILFFLFCHFSNAQKIKTSTKTLDSYFIQYPEFPLSYKYLEYKTNIIIKDTKFTIIVDGQPTFETDLSNDRYFKLIRQKASENYFPIGNLSKTNKEGNGVLISNVEILPMTLGFKTEADGNSWDKFINIFTLQIPIKITLKDGYSGEVVYEETKNIEYKNRDIAQWVITRSELEGLTDAVYPSRQVAQQAASNYLKNKPFENIAFPILDEVIGNNQLASYWNFYNVKYKLQFSRTGVLFLNLFKDDKNPKLAEYNSKINRVKDIAKDIEITAYKSGYETKGNIAELNELSAYFENEIKTNTDETILNALKTALVTTYFLTDNFEKNSTLIADLNSKGKINLRINSSLAKMKDLQKDKDNFEKEKPHLSATYTEALSKMIK